MSRRLRSVTTGVTAQHAYQLQHGHHKQDLTAASFQTWRIQSNCAIRNRTLHLPVYASRRATQRSVAIYVFPYTLSAPFLRDKYLSFGRAPIFSVGSNRVSSHRERRTHNHLVLNQAAFPVSVYGHISTAGETRTHTPFRAPEPKSGVSRHSTTAANKY